VTVKPIAVDRSERTDGTYANGSISSEETCGMLLETCRRLLDARMKRRAGGGK
jgi:hypothetical protein